MSHKATQMRAAVLAAPGQIRLERMALPEPGEGMVRVRLEGCGVCGSNLPPWEGRSWFQYPFPAGAPGHEGWGEIDAVGPKVSKVALYEAPCNDDPAAQKAWGEYIEGLTHALREDRRGDAVALFMSYVGVPPERISEVRQAPFFAGMEAVAPSLAYDHAAIMGPTASHNRIFRCCGSALFAIALWCAGAAIAQFAESSTRAPRVPLVTSIFSWLRRLHSGSD